MLCMFLGLSGTGGGWALTYKIAGREAAYSFVRLGAVVLLALFVLQILVWFMGERRAYCQALFKAIMALFMAWYLACIFFPLFWMNNIAYFAKITVGFFTIYLSASNMLYVVAYFEDRWNERGVGVFSKYFNRSSGRVRWEELMRQMGLSIALRIPGVPQKLVSIISGFSIVMMIVGLNLRNVFPVFSALAYGLPCAIIISCCASAVALNLAQASKLRHLEKKFEKKIYID